jgi:ribose transport system permease protein
MGQKQRTASLVAAGILRQKELPLVILIVVGSIALAIVSRNFLNLSNILAVFLGASFDALVAIGMTLLLISGGFDLSVGSTLAFGGVITGVLLAHGVGVVLSIVGGLATGALVGFVNGIIIAMVKVNPLITTLATMSIVRGLVFIFTRGLGIPNLPDGFNVIAQARIHMIQIPIIIMVIALVLSEIFFRFSIFFRQYFFIGGNEESARLSGIKVDGLKILGYTFAAFMAAVAGILSAARMGGAMSTAGTGTELTVITACIIGGCSLAGGEGSVLGSFLGVLLMALVANAFNLLGVSIYWQRAIYGLILLGAVLVDVVRRRRMEG